MMEVLQATNTQERGHDGGVCMPQIHRKGVMMEVFARHKYTGKGP